MNIETTYSIILFLCFWSSILYSQDSQYTISNDTMEFQLDKKAHLGVSFGLYYMFYTFISYDTINVHAQLDAMLLSSMVGLSYEVYQGSSFSNADGFSKEDMLYNLIGVAMARVSHEIFLYFKHLI